MLAHRRTPTRVARNPRGRAGGCAPSSETAAAGGAAATKPGSLSGRGPTYVARRATFRSNRAPTHANPRRSRQALSARGSARHRRRQKSRLGFVAPGAGEGFPALPTLDAARAERPTALALADHAAAPTCSTAPRSPPPSAALRPASDRGTLASPHGAAIAASLRGPAPRLRIGAPSPRPTAPRSPPAQRELRRSTRRTRTTPRPRSTGGAKSNVDELRKGG